MKYSRTLKIFSALLSTLLLCSCSMFSKPQEPDTVRITFAEGGTALQAAQLLEENGVCTKDEFIAVINNAERDNEFVKAIANPDERAFLLEGYIFPDTYDFYVGEGAERALGRFLSNMQTKITDNMKKRAAEMGLTMDEVINIAAIIQKESFDSQSMKNVSSVLHNRLNSSDYPRLQCDVTVLYVKRYIEPYFGQEAAEKYDALYSTYERKDLPAGPIANPGIEAINAALYPENTDYYFFVTDKDNNYYYAKTFEEHLKNCKTAGV